ncbi:MAG: (2Fe-2S)-binding protein [Dermatophilaceae bacterium]
MIICHCRVVNDSAVTEAVEHGARNLAEVCRATGAGGDCGACVFSVRRLLCDHDVSRSSQVPEAVHAAS